MDDWGRVSIKHGECINGSEEAGVKTLCPHEQTSYHNGFLLATSNIIYLSSKNLRNKNPKRTHCYVIIINIPDIKPFNDNFHHLEFAKPELFLIKQMAKTIIQ